MSPGSSYKHARINGDFDAIVIGSGAGGLGVAAFLAKLAHKRVLVLERHYIEVEPVPDVLDHHVRSRFEPAGGQANEGSRADTRQRRADDDDRLVTRGQPFRSAPRSLPPRWQPFWRSRPRIL